MRIQGLLATVVNIRGYDGSAYRDVLVDARRTLQTLNTPWPLYLAPGRLLLYDDLEGVLKWSQLEGTVSRDNTLHAFDGDYCLKILTGAVAGNWANSMRPISFPGRGKFRFMCHWHVWGEAAEPPDALLRELQIELSLYDGTYRQAPCIRYYKYLDAAPQEKWQYVNAAGVWTDVPGGAQFIHCGINAFGRPTDNFLALDFDITDGDLKILRLLSNDLDLKNLNLAGYHEETPATPGLSIRFGIQTNLDAAIAAYIDDIALGDVSLP